MFRTTSMKYLAAVLILLFAALPAHAQTKPQSAYDRVMETGTLRCGYVLYPPVIEKDPNTGEMSGITYDVMRNVGDLLDLKIEWTEELGWGNTVEAIKSGRVDAICVGFWQNPAEGKYLGFTVPMWYSAVNAWVRADDSRFDGDLSKLNDESVIVSGSDGEMSEIIARQDFPKAKIASKPNMTDASYILMDVHTKKADVAFVENYLAREFIAHNPGTLKNISQDRPLRVFGNTIAIPQDDIRFKSMLDSALVQIVNSGQMDKIIARYEKYPGSLLPVAPPYMVPQ